MALKQRGSLSIWFDPEMSWHGPLTGKRGRQPKFSDAAIQFCLTMKVLFGMPLRQTTGFVESLLRLAGAAYVPPSMENLQLRLDLRNLFDETYVARANDSAGDTSGRPIPMNEAGRTIALTATLKF